MNYNSYFKSFLQNKRDLGEYRYFLNLDKKVASFPRFDYQNKDGQNRSAINWCSNDYLAMSTHTTTIASFQKTSSQAGVGSGGTRNISGTSIHHDRLEKTIADLHQKEKALLFNSAYLANYTAIACLGKLIPGLIIYSDSENHASIIEGVKNAACEKRIFKHNDVNDLERLLKLDAPKAPKVIVFESVYSMSGTIAPIKGIIQLAKKYKTLTYVDEVHAVGLFGPNAAGIFDQEEMTNDIDIINGTLAKAFGVLGGYVAGQKDIVDAIRLKGAGLIFTTSLPPAICTAANDSIEHVRKHPALRRLFFKNVNLLRKTFRSYGISYRNDFTQITTIVIGDSKKCKLVSDQLLSEHGIYIQPINFPTVPKGEECLRITITPRHTEQEILQLAQGLSDVLKVNTLHEEQIPYSL